MSRKVEQYSPILAACFFTWIAYYFDVDDTKIINFEQILNAVINISAILIGFLGAMVSILIVSSSKKVIRLLKTCNRIDCFNGYFKCAVIIGMASACFSVIMLGMPKQVNLWHHYLFYIWLFFITLFIGSAARIIYIMLKILASVLAESDQQ